MTARVDFTKADFDKLVRDKGVQLQHEQAVRCGCVSEQSGNGLPDCVTCYGVGFFFINATNIKGVIQSVNSNPKFTQWSELNAGTASVTVEYRSRIAWMDRLTNLDGESVYTETVYVKPLLVGGQTKMVGLLTYASLDIQKAYRFDGSGVPLVELVEDTDFDISGRVLTMLIGNNGDNRSMHISLRYRHRPQYIVMDIPKDIRNTRSVVNGGVEERQSLPVLAIIKKCHYFLGGTGVPNAAEN